ncbi:MAG: hypothetical protein R3B70_40845 [Polyangiaceae bacterium]
MLHDPTLVRVTASRDARRAADLAEELARVRFPGGERALLAEVLELWPCEAGVNVEMKHDAPDRGAVVRATARVLSEAGAARYR